MVNGSKVPISKNFLKRSLVESEDIAKSLSRFIDNSIKARSMITTKEDPCRVDIKLFEDLIVISDNSGGLDSNLSGEDIFKIGSYDGYELSGLGIKKSFFRLGNKIDIISNKKDYSKTFTVDFNLKDDELIIQKEVIKYKDNEVEGTDIFISDLEKSTKKEISGIGCISNILSRLGRIYSKFIEKGELQIRINKELVEAKHINLSKINTCNILDNYTVDLYKGSKHDISGIDLFINDYMIYDRVKNKEVQWNLLNEAKHSYRDCIVEISYNGDKEKFIEDKETLFIEVINFIKENKIHFQSKTITIQFEMEIGKVDDLKEYYDENTAKAVGIIAFNKLYESYVYNNKKLI